MEVVNGSLEFLARGGEVLEEFDFVIEMDDEGFVFIFTEKMVEKRAAGGKFLSEDAALAEAGVHEEAECEGEIGFFGEIGDGLWLGVLSEDEVVFGEIVDEGAVFIANGGEEIDRIDVDSDGSGLLGEYERVVKEEKEEKEIEERM
jgi:hypothetical protein